MGSPSLAILDDLDAGAEAGTLAEAALDDPVDLEAETEALVWINTRHGRFSSNCQESDSGSPPGLGLAGRHPTA